MGIIYQPIADFQGTNEGSSSAYPDFVQFFVTDKTSNANFADYTQKTTIQNIINAKTPPATQPDLQAIAE